MVHHIKSLISLGYSSALHTPKSKIYSRYFLRKISYTYFECRDDSADRAADNSIGGCRYEP